MRTEGRGPVDAGAAERWRGRAVAIASWCVALLAVLPGAPGWGGIQGQVPDSAAAVDAGERPDTIPVDSTLLRLRQQLQLLSRGPGSDSVRAQARADSAGARQAAGRGGAVGQRTTSLGGGEDVYSRLRALEGYAVTEFQGTSAEYVADAGKLYLYGDSARPAAVLRQGDELRAREVIEYDEEAQILDARGAPVFVPANGDEMRANNIRYDLNTEVGRATNALSRYDEGAEWIVRGDLPEIRPSLAYGSHTSFTSCDLDEPHYHFATDQLKIVRGSVLVARPVRLYFGDVPVAWLPFIAQSLNTGRSSGLLTPQFSVNDIVRTSGGYRRRISNVGFYWAMSDYADALMALDWFDNTFTALTGSVRYRWSKRFLQGTLDMRRFWRAEGGTELTLNTAHSWEISERTSFRARGAYASSTNLVRQNSFNPQEVTQSIDSEGGLSRRFDWGNLTVNGNRRQFLSDDRVVTTFPSVNLSMKTLTLFPAPQNRASFFNNMTLSGSGSFRRTSTDLAEDQVDTGEMSGSLNSSLNLGNLAVSGGASFRESTRFGVSLAPDTVPTDSVGNLLFAPGEVAERGGLAFHDPAVRALLLNEDRTDISNAGISWNAGIDYQQNLVGSTTFSPRLQLSGEYARNDTSTLASSFVAGPTRLTFGAQLRGDMYAFLPGFGGYDRVRHKVSPSFSYDYSPQVEPTPLQEQIFGAGVRQPRNVLTFGINQTFEAKREASTEPGGAATGPSGGATGGSPPAGGATGETAADSVASAGGGDGTAAGGTARAGEGEVTEDGFRRPPRDEIVTLLALRTSAITYDFVADSAGSFIDGITTSRLTNNITSDFLRGLSINMAHDLFDQETDEATGAVERTFAPHLSSLNFSFSLNNNSGIFRWLGIAGAQAEGRQNEQAAEDDEFGADDDPLGLNTTGINDGGSIVPGGAEPGRRRRSGAGGVGQWSANFSYALNRPRSGDNVSQMLQMNFRLQPTEAWEMSWRTAFDLENNEFADHTVRLTRALHRWEANFDFVQTATGNWTFRFEVRLTDNQDLKFDYQQRSLDRRDAFGSRF